MKKYFTSILIFTTFCASLNLTAQTPAMHFDYPGDTCFAVVDFPTVPLVLAEFHRLNFGYDFCNGPCPIPGHKSCLPKLTNSDQTVIKENDFICLKGWMRFKWICAPVQDPGPDITINEIGGVRPASGIGGGSHGGGTGDPFGIKKSIATTTLNVFPNPSDGTGEIMINMTTEQSDLEYRVHNVAGQIILKKQYDNLNSGAHKFPYELPEKEKGIYFITVKINDQVVDHVKLLVF